MNNNHPVRVRFAPSPTGPLHIGGVRTALYNYLFAKQKGGAFILRIEDTDQTRFVPGAEEYIIESLNWLGIQFDEGVQMGGAYGPYRQSDRKPMYKAYAVELIKKGFAYYAFDTAEELDVKRKEAEQQKSVFQYDQSTRMQMRNSLSLSAGEAAELLSSGAPYVVRFMFPADTEITVHDLIRGEVKVMSSTLDDKVLYKSDGMPTYHLANIVDDHLMEITHVIRGEEWLPSAPLHVMLYKAFGWEDSMPEFAHLPLLLKPDGNGKLSKRDGDRLGFPVFPLQWADPKSGEISSGYRESGYLPETVVNFLALLGWNPGTQQEIFSLQELTELFSLDRVSKSGAKFDYEKGKWFNHQYIQKLSPAELTVMLEPVLKDKGIECPADKLAIICGLLKERATFISDFIEQGMFFFEAPKTYDQAVVNKRWKENSGALLSEASSILEALNDFSAGSIHDSLMGFAESKGIGAGQVMIPLRLAMVGAASGPDLTELMAVLGKEEVISRIDTAVKTLT